MDTFFFLMVPVTCIAIIVVPMIYCKIMEHIDKWRSAYNAVDDECNHWRRQTITISNANAQQEQRITAMIAAIRRHRDARGVANKCAADDDLYRVLGGQGNGDENGETSAAAT